MYVCVVSFPPSTSGKGRRKRERGERERGERGESKSDPARVVAPGTLPRLPAAD